MTNYDNFKTALDKAIANGYRDYLEMLPELPTNKTSADCLVKQVLWSKRYEIIFSHPFAKALWGENNLIFIEGRKQWIGNWKVALQRMVMKENPFEYLNKDRTKDGW